MSAAITQILVAASAVLLGNTTAGARVFVNRADPLTLPELPAILLAESASGESIEPYFLDGQQKRDAELELRCIVAGDLSAASTAAALGLEAEVLMAASPVLASLCRLGFELASSTPELSAEVTQLVAERRQIWRISYTTSRANPALINP
jgi:hypothetical protein